MLCIANFPVFSHVFSIKLVWDIMQNVQTTTSFFQWVGGGELSTLLMDDPLFGLYFNVIILLEHVKHNLPSVLSDTNGKFYAGSFCPRETLETGLFQAECLPMTPYIG